MNTPELRQLKMAWLAAREAGDQQEQLRLLRAYPEQQDNLIDFIAGYHATGGDATNQLSADVQPEIIPLAQRAFQNVLERVIEPQSNTQTTVATLAELRKSLNLSKAEAARRLRLSIDVWNKFESGAIDLFSLTQRQLERLSGCFNIGIDQFSSLLTGSQPAISLNRRQTRQASQHDQQGPQRQSFAEALARSTMSAEDKEFWQA